MRVTSAQLDAVKAKCLEVTALARGGGEETPAPTTDSARAIELARYIERECNGWSREWRRRYLHMYELLLGEPIPLRAGWLESSGHADMGSGYGIYPCWSMVICTNATNGHNYTIGLPSLIINHVNGDSRNAIMMGGHRGNDLPNRDCTRFATDDEINFYFDGIRRMCRDTSRTERYTVDASFPIVR